MCQARSRAQSLLETPVPSAQQGLGLVCDRPAGTSMGGREEWQHCGWERGRSPEGGSKMGLRGAAPSHVLLCRTQQ